MHNTIKFAAFPSNKNDALAIAYINCYLYFWLILLISLSCISSKSFKCVSSIWLIWNRFFLHFKSITSHAVQADNTTVEIAVHKTLTLLSDLSSLPKLCYNIIINLRKEGCNMNDTIKFAVFPSNKNEAEMTK